MSTDNYSASSQFKLISIGTVAENKSRTTNIVEVVMSESHPYIDGEINSNVTTDAISGTDASGNAQTFNVKMSNTVQCKWRGDGTNRISAPDVRRGDKVEIYQFGDHDGYYWSAMTQPDNPNVRKRETVIHGYSNTTDESQGELTPDNAWYSEVNTHEKHWTIKTNKSDGEPFAYTAQIDAKNGNAVLCDDTGNIIQLDSSGQHITVATSAGASFEIIKRDVEVNCDNFKVNAAKEISLNAQTGAVSIPETQWKGNTTQQGNLSITGNMVSSGGTYTFNGNVVTTGGLVNNGKDVGSGHSHTNVKSGTDHSGPVG